MNEYFYIYLYLDPRKPGKYCYEQCTYLYEPIYVGKGMNGRCFDHLKYLKNKKRSYFKYKLQAILNEGLTLQNYILILRSHLAETEAFMLEKGLINEIGRQDLNLGPLTNLTDGGEGASGAIRTKETKRKLSDAKKGEKNPRFGKPSLNSGKPGPNKGRPLSEEHRLKISKGNTGKKMSEEARRKISEMSNHSGKNNPMYGKKHSEETRKKISKATIGKIVSEETKRKIAETQRRLAKENKK